MNKTDNTKLITVGQLVKELEKYEKKHWDWNVEISTDESVGEDEDLPCIIIGMGLDKEGDLRIEIEEEWDGGGDYYIAELLEHLREFDAGTRVYLAGGGLLFSIDNQGGIFAETDEEDDTLSCTATAFGEYEEHLTGGRASKAEKRERARKFDKVPWGFIAVVLLAVAALIAAFYLGIYYNVLAICIIAFVALIAIMVVVARVDTCPYCGSIRLEKEKIDPNLNGSANWSVRCKRCREHFFMG